MKKRKEFNFKLYTMIRENGGFEMFKMIEVEKYHCNDKREAVKRENEVMKESKATMNKNRSFNTEEERLEQHRKRSRQRFEENKDKEKQFYETNKENFKDKRKQHYVDNKERILLQKKQYNLRKKKEKEEENTNEVINE